MLTTQRDPAYDFDDASQDGALAAFLKGEGPGFAKLVAGRRFIDQCRRRKRFMELLAVERVIQLPDRTPAMKRCPKCGCSKTVDEFWRSKTADGLYAYCKTCGKTYGPKIAASRRYEQARIYRSRGGLRFRELRTAA